MTTRMDELWDSLKSSLWFIPALMAIAAALLSFATIAFDWRTRDELAQDGWLWAGGPEGARELLSTIAGSMITVTGVIFSITMVVLTLASSKFGARLLRNFLRDTGTKVVLGSFIATFAYCLLILRTVRSTPDAEFVPHASITLAIALTLASVGLLIYFIHHISVSIQAPIIIARVADEIDRGIERLFPEKLGSSRTQNSDPPPVMGDFDRDTTPLSAQLTGYLRSIDTETLMECAVERDLFIRLLRRPGHFIVYGDDLALIAPTERIDKSLIDELNNLFLIGPERSEVQDLEFAIQQIVEVALRALSPGVNEAFTAITCVDQLGAVLCRLAEREIPSPYRYDSNDKLRLIAAGVDFPGALDTAFNEIRQDARSNAAVTMRLLETLRAIALRAQREADRAAVLRQADMIARGSRDGLHEEQDRKDVQERYEAVLAALSLQNETQPGSPRRLGFRA